MFMFCAPGYCSGVIYDPNMTVLPNQQIGIRYEDGNIQFRGVISLATGGYCFGSLLNLHTRQLYHLWSRAQCDMGWPNPV